MGETPDDIKREIEDARHRLAGEFGGAARQFDLSIGVRQLAFLDEVGQAGGVTDIEEDCEEPH